MAEVAKLGFPLAARLWFHVQVSVMLKTQWILFIPDVADGQRAHSVWSLTE